MMKFPAKLFLPSALWTVIVLPCAFCQSTTQAQTPKVPEWQTAAGGKLEFEVASVKQNKTDEKPSSTFPLNPGTQFVPNSGHLIATNMVLLQYIVFAYKMNSYQIQSFRSHLPEWAKADHFDIQTQADGSPNKDQERLMMQSLLEDRFKLRVHHEIRQVPVYALVLAKPGKTGPNLHIHPADDPDCTKTPMPETVAGSYPSACGASATIPASAPGLTKIGGRKVTIEYFTLGLTNLANNIDRPVIDQTGLTGLYDFTLEWAPEPDGPPSADSQAEFIGATFAEALREQLGFKIVRQMGPVDVLVLDSVEYPTEN